MAEEQPEQRPLRGTAPYDKGDLTNVPPPHRPPPAVAREAAEGGRIVIDEPARLARTDPVAIDGAMAYVSGVEPGASEPPIAHELIAIMRMNIAAAVAALADRHATAVARCRAARALVTDREQQVEATAPSEAQAEPPRPETPPGRPEEERPRGGTSLIHPAIPYAAAFVFAVFEFQFGGPVIQPLTGMSDDAARVTAAMLVLVLTAVFDQAARALAAPLARVHRRVAYGALALVAVAAVASATLAVTLLGDARPTNIAYHDAHSRVERPRGLSFGTGQRSLHDPVVVPKREAGPAKPDARFVVPLTLASLLGTLLFSLRSGLADGWRERRAVEADERRREHEREAARAVRLEEHRAAQRRLEEAREEEAAADAELETVAIELATAGRREAAFTESMFARFEGEFGRVSGTRGMSAPAFALPPVPDPAQEIAELLYPGQAPAEDGPPPPADDGPPWRDEPAREPRPAAPPPDRGSPRWFGSTSRRSSH